MSTALSSPDYQHLFRSLPGNYLLLTPDGTVVECSTDFVAASGRPAQELVGASLGAALQTTPEQTARLQEALNHARRTQQPHTVFLPAAASPARVSAPQSLTFRPLPDAQGARFHLVTLGPDLAHAAPADSTLQALEQQLAATNLELQRTLADAQTQRKRLHELLMQAPASIASLTGPEHVFELVNPGYQRLVGTRPLLGKSIREGLPELVGQGFFELLDQVFDTGITCYGNESVAYLDRENSGNLVPSYFNFIYQATHNPAGQVEGVLIFAYDVTEQVVTRRKVERSEQDLQNANEELATINEELHAANEEFHANNAELSSTQQELRALNQELEARVQQRTRELELAQRETELQRARLEHFFMQAPAAICILSGPDLVFELVNTSYQQMFPGRKLRGLPLLQALPELAGQPVENTLRQVYKTGITHEEKGILVSMTRHAGGPLEDLYFDYIQQARFDGRGAVDGVMVFAYEVTEQVRARQLEAQNARAFEILTDTIPHLVWTATATGAVDYYNQQWYSYTGSTLEESEGLGWVSFYHPDDVASIQDQWVEAVREGRPYQVEARLRNAEGAFRWFLIRALPFQDEHGATTKWFGANTDIHEQKRLSQALLESERYFRVMADKVPVMVWVTRPDGQCVYLNQQWYEYTGQTEAEALGFGWLDATHPDEAAQAGKIFRDSNARQVPYSVVFRLKTKTGAYRWVVDTGLPKFSATGEFEGFVGSVVDIHERKMAEQALRLASQKLAATNKDLRAANQQSQLANAELAQTNEQLTRINQDLDNFVYTASHDLRQPVNNMAGVFEELKRSATFHDPQAEQLIHMFESSLHQIHGTIQGLAEVVYVERRNGQTQSEPVALLPLTHGIIQSMQSQATAARAEFQLDFTAAPTIRFARLDLQSVLYNLLSNALKYADPDRPAQIRVATELTTQGTPVLLVQDNGIGLDVARYGTDLFKMFRRFHDHVPGSGVGLYLVNRIVQQVGGRIEVDSTVGLGTTFRIHLPQSK